MLQLKVIVGSTRSGRAAFRNKPSAVVAHRRGPVGRAGAVEHLAQIGIELKLVPLRNSVLIPFVHDAFDDTGVPRHPRVNRIADIVLDDLAWSAQALRGARDAGTPPPAQIRLLAASTSTSK